MPANANANAKCANAKCANVTYDQHGTPGVWALSIAEAWHGVGWLHGRHRPLQALLLGAAGRGELAGCLLPRTDLVSLDALVHRLDIPAAGRRQSAQFDRAAGDLVDAYLRGFADGLRSGGQPFELRALAARLPPLDRASLVSSLLVAAFLGLAQCQERMELAIVEALRQGAAPELLQCMFRPHLAGWHPDAIRAAAPAWPTWPGAGAVSSVTPVGGSNAWAVAPERTASGAALLCGDPHLQINQLPGLFFEMRVRVGDAYWLGATIPGLPAFAVGRTRHVAWSGTFSVADNVDLSIETLHAGRIVRGEAVVAVVQERQVAVRRRGRSPVRLCLRSTDRGTLLGTNGGDGPQLASRWAGGQGAAAALQAYMTLPMARNAAHAEAILAQAHTLNLHFVLADRDGDIRHCQAGRVPRRRAGWSGLYPVPAGVDDPWIGMWQGEALPRSRAVDGCVVSANEGRAAADGAALATMAQPAYRRQRITDLLLARRDHDLASMQALQQDLYSLQAARLRSGLVQALDDGPLARALRAWDGCYNVDSVGAHAFEITYRAARDALCARLGGAWTRQMLRHSELGVWWCEGFDRLLADASIWQQPATAPALREALAGVAGCEPQPWGNVQRLTLRHLIFGGLPRWLGLDRGPLPLPGSIATVSQGNGLEIDGAALSIGPAYRMVCDLGDDALYSSLPGGVDGSCFAASYDQWLADWQHGRYHRVAPPQDSERALRGGSGAAAVV